MYVSFFMRSCDFDRWFGDFFFFFFFSFWDDLFDVYVFVRFCFGFVFVAMSYLLSCFNFVFFLFSDDSFLAV